MLTAISHLVRIQIRVIRPLQVCLLLYHILGIVLHREQFLTVTSVGYSGVLFG